MTASTMQKAASESASFSNLPPEYFLATDRGDIYIIKGIKIWWFISLLLIQMETLPKSGVNI